MKKPLNIFIKDYLILITLSIETILFLFITNLFAQSLVDKDDILYTQAWNSIIPISMGIFLATGILNIFIIPEIKKQL